MADPQHAPNGTHQPTLPRWVLAVILVLVALNLRPTMAGLPPLIPQLRTDLGIGSTAIGALTTLPVLCMGLFAPVASWLAHRQGAIPSVGLGTLLLVLGPLARWQGDQLWLLYGGTLLGGVGIAIVGTLLPQLVKSWFPPERAGFVTGLYMLAMMVGAALSAAVAVPLADALGSWQASLGSWAVLALVGGLAWLPVRRNPDRGQRETVDDGPRARLPWHHSTAWTLAAYMALQSWCFYTCLSWIAPGYVELGWSPEDAGYMMSLFSGVQLLSGLGGPALADRCRDKRPLLVLAALLSGVGVLGLALAPQTLPWLWVAVTGLGQGAAFPLGLFLFVEYAATPAASGRLTSMAFLVSYSLAAFGPIVMGAAHDAFDGFRVVWLVIAAVAAVQLLVSLRMAPSLRRVD